MKHVIDNESWYPWGDIKNRYTYYEKTYNQKLTLERLEELVKEGIIESREIPVEGTPYTYTIYSEYDIVVALAKHKFQKAVEIKTKEWF